MGFSSIAGFLVLISTLLACSLYLYDNVDSSLTEINSAYSEYIEHLSDKSDEKLIITSVVGVDGNIYINVLNNGSLTNEPYKWTALYNGTPKGISIDSNITYLTPLNNVTITIIGTAPARICIVSEYGNKYYYYLN
ncbi:flagellar protein F [Methanococcus aeolicus Nankai-3]|jgi:flagellar protein FlaF|uniref:Flagellar protein F n=2 Tax=Methanococcus aeolicus TaxID=42879 RepID=A6UTN1_META3|nr:flagellar protein F [Methanococcus aeolicus Nankai-3]